ncbi:MAG: hypothetical protein A3G33_08090 [Omnitrophica bacterium RIFCSPLOWO2_12_FULL_44_17]|uniref:Uncharacterized protein n=1 Tax=Candidatus Danuiimicrobium aquiferis TaxID=1801832 RepID=A0A1G1KY54_9BACT|nr:MAG: hypothetical protein A3B72_05790 [Omnitrophica bacterium RIFCSPHIGHO2_02_FULL_45_28]OGW92341.1 MAG: hypothetical protein A3E74_09405 [Omnitrophica bacterium RIFCSPHIGHO2_12_FULL_44_12]OGW97762.1 MAG: hypothetical protein A3G33_08090 [Omnitrophica bacterium RIFCSPLOWO2_12_FULL_44_17]OGX04986.1 MAG: hypothetical protein A3J12_02120 [Omnitrophica bacterium RIFCSPLOWO2_02_FULL_44_11]
MNLLEAEDSKVVSIKGFEFTIGVINRQTFRKLSAALDKSKSALLGRAGEIKAEDIERIRIEEPDRFYDVMEQMTQAYKGFVRYGVTGHKGLLNKKGEEISFTKEGDIVSEKTLELYELNSLTIELGNAVIAFNTLSDEERKN